MTPEKGKHKPLPHQEQAKQAHLEIRNEEADLSSRIDRLVSLTYDSDSAVRKKAALELAKIDDPRSIFALLELSSDKDREVKELALSNLNNFNHEKEAIVNLEKVFEARQVGQQPAEDFAESAQKLMPSIERLFSNKDPSLKARLMPSIIAKYFSSSAFAARHTGSQAQQKQPPQEENSGQQKGMQEGRTEYFKEAPVQPQNEGKAEYFEEGQAQQLDVEKIDDAPQERQKMAERPSHSLSPRQQGEQSLDFPLPEGLKAKTMSPISEIESMMPEAQKEETEDEAVKLHPNRLAFYQWAYALAVDPKMTQSKIRSEEKRLISQLKKDVELAFRLAISRAKTTGIESLSGLKPGMRKVETFPLLVTEVRESSVTSGKKSTSAMRIALSDGKHTVPLYIEPRRAVGISVGDHVSLHDCKVDFFVETNELVFITGKKGYINVSK